MRNTKALYGGAFLALGVLAGAGGALLLSGGRSDDSPPGGGADGEAPAVQTDADGRRILYWRAPMDPNYTSDRPGKSPMGMDLVPVYEDDALADGQVRVSPSFLQNFAVRTAEVARGSVPVSIRTVGILAHNEERLVSVQTKYEGWIERASVNNVGETVERGDVLFEIYSPELLTTQREFLGAMDYVRRLRDGGAYREAVARAESLLEATRERLLYWDMTEAQIDELARSRTVSRTIRVFAPATGFIVDKLGDSLEGMKLEPGMSILKIADHSMLWAETEFYEGDLRHVAEGGAVEIEADAFPGRTWDGRILFFRPALNAQTRTLSAFVEVDNRDLLLRPGMYVDVTARAGGATDALMVASEAVIHSGARAVVIVARGGGVFEPREVQLGTEGEGLQEVSSGLEAGEQVLVSSQFLIDTDANLKAAISQLLGSAEAGPSGTQEMPGMSDMPATDEMPAMPMPGMPATHEMPGMPDEPAAEEMPDMPADDEQMPGGHDMGAPGGEPEGGARATPDGR
ncbi:MAG: efflux RND transporter periplasmic adaptor subunit [Gemmatimonadota bacterium]|nr:efflux RND transporter periplasmic adaptor subunit [Gemmatimonadota bacterium]